MTITLEQITAQQERFQREIVERESILAALGVLHAFVKNRPGKKSIELGSLVSVFAPATIDLPLKELADASPPEPAALPAAPSVPPAPSYMHPKLRDLGRVLHGRHGRMVSWAIQHMTEDYSLQDIARLLEREGFPMRTAEISVVLTRMKSRGEIEQIKPGHGPKPAIFANRLVSSWSHPNHPGS